LIPKGPLDDKVLRAAITRYIDAVLKGDEINIPPSPASLRRDYPRFQRLTDIGDDPDEVARAKASAIDAVPAGDREIQSTVPRSRRLAR
jgi:hypothetical protein